jgi:nucleotide-binding universal stress UspA family protein
MEGAALARDAGLHAHPVTITGERPWRSLLSAAKDADVLGCGTRGLGPLDRAVLGSTASSLVHHTQLPLLVVPASANGLDGRLLVGYDGSEGARAALAFAAERLREHRLIVACAWRSPVRHSLRGRALLRSPETMSHDYAEGLDDVWREVAEDTAEEGTELARSLGLHAQSRAAESGAGDAHALLEAARNVGAAAVLVGSRGRGAVAATVLGSVTSGLVHAGAMPVLIVPTRDELLGAARDRGEDRHP